MINYKKLEIGSVYSPTKRMFTTDLSHEITPESCFTVLENIDIVWSKNDYRGRVVIFYNELKQVLILTPDRMFKKII